MKGRHMNKLTILHLSDLHYCSKTKNDIHIIQGALLNDLMKIIENDSNLYPDLVIFSGDMVFDGNKDDFFLSWENILKPILDKTNLDKNRFIFCPGNHDIERGKVKDYIDAGLNAKLTSRDAVNVLIDNLNPTDDSVFSRLDNYNDFKKSIESKHLIQSHPLFSTYKIDLGHKIIGIACLNSAWRSFGEDKNDLGKLLMGERALINAIDSISNCDIKIGVVHHPFEFLNPFEQIDLKRQALRSFDLWFHGHQHEQDFEHIKPLTEEGCLLIKGGALYQSRDYHNGYNLISISMENNNGEILFREYFDRTKIFAEAVAYAENGVISFNLPKKALQLSHQAKIISQIRQGVNTGAVNFLGSSIVELSQRPKTLDKVFVEPPLATDTEEGIISREVVGKGKKKVVKSKEDVVKSLEYLLDSKDNMLFIGKRESGKTSLLKYIFNLYINNPQGKTEQIPILINYKHLHPGKDRVLKAIKSQLINLDINIDIQAELDAGNCLILIDDFSFDVDKYHKDLHAFTEKYSNNRFIITIDQSILGDIGVTELPDIGIEYQKIYIHSLKRRQIRELVRKWFSDANLPEKRIEDVAEQVFAGIMAINLPTTPLIVSLLLVVAEQQAEFMPINRATLVEKFVEMLLQKINPSDIQSGGLDFRNKEDILSHIAFYMDDREEYELPINSFYSEVESYFRNRGLIPPRQLETFIYDNFIARGILTEFDGKVSFRFSCFTEYFIAKYLSENQEFLERIKHDDEKFLSYYSEIDYLTGLQRKNKDLAQFIGERAKSLTDEFFISNGINVSLDEIGKISMYESESREESINNKKRKTRLTEEETDELIDGMRSTNNDTVQRIIRKRPDSLESKAIFALTLLSTVIKNCELIADKEFKKYYVNFCVEQYLKFLYVITIRISDQISAMDEETFRKNAKELNVDVEGEDFEVIKGKVSAVLPMLIAIQVIEIAKSTLATPKLETIFEEEIANQENHVAKRLAYTLFYADLKLPAYLDKLEKIIKEIIKNDFFCEIIKQKLLYYYDFRKLTSKEKNQIENLIAGINVRNLDRSNLRKSSVIAEIRNQHKRNTTGSQSI